MMAYAIINSSKELWWIANPYETGEPPAGATAGGSFILIFRVLIDCYHLPSIHREMKYSFNQKIQQRFSIGILLKIYKSDKETGRVLESVSGN